MRGWPTLATPALALALCACAADAEITTARFALRQLPSCPIDLGARLEVVTSSEETQRSATVDPAGAAVTLPALPPDTRAIVVRSRARDAGGAAVLAGESESRALLLLPLGRSCPLGDPLARLSPGAVAAALPLGALLLAGGFADGDVASAAALVLPPSAALVEQARSELLLRRAHATATRVGELVVVAGGFADRRGSAHDTLEVFDAALGGFDVARSQKLLTGPRARHGAALLASGRVLLAGGTDGADGEPLASAELLDAQGGPQVALEGARGLAHPRLSPAVVAAGAGALVVGGVDAAGALVPGLERFDAGKARFETVDLALTGYAALAATATPDGQVALVGCGAASCALHVLSASGQQRLVRPLDTTLLSALQLLALPDGRLLLEGRDPRSLARHAYLVATDTGATTAREASRVPLALVRLDDGTIAELDDAGASLRRETLALPTAPTP